MAAWPGWIDPELAALAAKVLVTAWMVVIAVKDHRTGLIPNRLTAPVFIGVGAYRVIWQGLIQGEWSYLALLLAYAVLFGLWMLKFIGGGDAKFLMALSSLFPTIEFATLLALFLLLVTVPLLIWEIAKAAHADSIGGVFRSVRDRLLSGQVLPTEQDLHERGRRYAWTFAIPGIIYTWIYWL